MEVDTSASAVATFSKTGSAERPWALTVAWMVARWGANVTECDPRTIIWTAVMDPRLERTVGVAEWIT
jgi:hypothetical protein